MESTTCIVCGGAKTEPFMKVADRLGGETPAIFELVRCSCSMVYLNPRPGEGEIAPYYASEEYQPHRMDGSGGMDLAYRAVQSLALRIKARRIEHEQPSGRLLDIGGGQGEFASFMAARGWHVDLQDRDSSALRAARARGLRAVEDLSTLAKSGEQYDLATMWHALEHIHDIPGLFDRLENLLAPGGALVVAVPNLDAPERESFGSRWAPYDAPRHLYHFSRATLTALLRKYGWKMERVWPLWWDTPYNVLLSVHGMGAPGLAFAVWQTVRSLVVTASSPMERGSSMMVLARRAADANNR
jgi:SAM-dependent methyltransferase